MDERLQTFTGRNAAMEFLKELRKNPDQVRATGNLRPSLSIPPADFEILKAKYPVLRDGNSGSDDRKKFWRRFARSSESIPYRVIK